MEGQIGAAFKVLFDPEPPRELSQPGLVPKMRPKRSSWPTEKGLDLSVLHLSPERDCPTLRTSFLGGFPNASNLFLICFRSPFWKGAAGSGAGSGRTGLRGRTGTWSWGPCACQASTGEENTSTPGLRGGPSPVWGANQRPRGSLGLQDPCQGDETLRWRRHGSALFLPGSSANSSASST